MNKLDYLLKQYPEDLLRLDPSAPPLFGKMNVLQMIAHMGYAFRQAAGLVPLEPTGDEETTSKMYRFMMSDKPFRDNTPNPYLPDEPEPSPFSAMPEAVEALRAEQQAFVQAFEGQPERRILNPFFGNLNFEEWVHLLHKHALHHLRQFGSIPAEA